MTTEQLLILCLIRRCNITGEQRATTQVAIWLNLPRNQVLEMITGLYRGGYVERLASPLLTEAGERLVMGRYTGWIDGRAKLFEIVRRY